MHDDFGEKSMDWGVVLQGDRFYALLQIRALTYGPTYAFAVHGQSAACRERIEWENWTSASYRVDRCPTRAGHRCSRGTALRPHCRMPPGVSGSVC